MKIASFSGSSVPGCCDGRQRDAGLLEGDRRGYARLVTADGQEIGRVEEVAGDPQADIFDGLVVSLAGHHAGRRDRRYVAAERVGRIWPDRVEVDLGADEAARLPAYTEPKSVTWRASDGGRVTDRLRSAFKDLFGRRG